MELKQRIEAAVVLSGKKKAHIANEIGVSPSAITQWITGQTVAIDGVNLLRFARATGVRYEWLALEEGDMTKQGLTITDPMLINAVHSLEKLPVEFRVEQIKGCIRLLNKSTNSAQKRTAPNNVITLPVQFSIRFECEIFSGTWMDYHLLHRMRAHGQQRRSEKRAGTQGLYPQHTLPFDGQDDG